MINYEEVEKSYKQDTAISDFNLLLQNENIAFYKGCEVTQIFIFDKLSHNTINFYTLFSFDEQTTSHKTVQNYLTPCLQKLDDRYSFGLLQQRITIDDAKQCFSDIQKGKLCLNELCIISSGLFLLPKTYISSLSSLKPAFLNKIIKPNYWGDNYIIEFFDEQKHIFDDSYKNARSLFDKIAEYANKIQSVRIDLTQVYDRIGNIIFQFPITIFNTKIFSMKNGIDQKLIMKPHPQLTSEKELQILMISTLDDTITGFDFFETKQLDFEHTFHVGDDNNLKTVVSDKKTKLILHQSEINFIKGFNIFGKISMQNAEPRTIIYRDKDSHRKEIELFSRDSFGSTIDKMSKTYEDFIRNRHRNNDLLKHSEDYSVQINHEEEKALSFIKGKLKNLSDIKEICLWDPYLLAADIIETLYFESTQIPFRCITSYQKAKKNTIGCDSFLEFKKRENEYFITHSNNLGIKLKYLAQHDDYGWQFHDRFLILVPIDDTALPDAYSLGTSINSLGKYHHIIQKVTDSRVILNNFENLWQLLDNPCCQVAQFPK